MLYRLDHIDANGVATPICDMIGPVLIRSWALARKLARGEAAGRAGIVHITRINASGRMTDAADVYPDGRAVRCQSV